MPAAARLMAAVLPSYAFQVLPGSGEPTVIRAALQTALPTAPPRNKQLVTEASILHLTIARLLAPARLPPAGHLASAPRQVRLGSEI